MKAARCRIEVNLEELDRVLDGAREAPLSEADHDKLKDTYKRRHTPLHRLALAARWSSSSEHKL
jgi:hypothetical protein